MAFRHTVYGFPIAPGSEWAAKVALGTLLSTLGRYWLYMVSGSWGSRNDDVRVDDLLDLPLRLHEGHPATVRIIEAVDSLPRSASRQPELSHSPAAPDVDAVLEELNDAVCDLFDLTPSENDLVRDFWMSRAPSGMQTVGLADDGARQLGRYLEVFNSAWRPTLGEDAEFDHQVWEDTQAQVIAAAFRTRSPETPAADRPDEHDAWSAVLKRFDLAYPQAPSGSLLSYGMVRAVADSAIVIIKRNESHLWSATAAREDAEATIAQAIRLQRA
jgi:hypothetical protein